MTNVSIKLDTSDFTVWLDGDRVKMQIDGPTDTVELDMDPGVANDLFVMLADPQPED